MRTWFGPIAFILLAACGVAEGPVPVSSPAPPPVAPPSPAPTPPATPPEPAPPAVVSPCEVHAAAFRAALASATGACTTDADCGCYSPVVEEAGCGGITDATTSGRLGVIEAAFHADGCPWPHLCGPWSCVPVCVEGRCAPQAGVGGS